MHQVKIIKPALLFFCALLPLLIFGWLILKSAEDTHQADTRKAEDYGRRIVSGQLRDAITTVTEYKSKPNWYTLLRSDSRIIGYRDSSHTLVRFSEIAKAVYPRSKEVSGWLLKPEENREVIRDWLQTARTNYAPTYILFVLQESKLDSEFIQLKEQLEWEIKPDETGNLSGIINWSKSAFKIPEGFEWRETQEPVHSFSSYFPIYVEGKPMDIYNIEPEPTFIRPYALIACFLWILFLIGFLIYYSRKKEREVQQSLDQLSVVGHELRTPLTGMKLMLERLIGSTTDDSSRDYLSRIENERSRLEGVMEQFLIQGKLQREKLQLQSMSWQEWLKGEYERSLELSDKARLYELSLQPSHNTSTLIDPSLFGIVLSNLLNNAENYGEGSKILLKEISEDQKVGFEVIDDGPGMSSSLIKKAFLKYHRGDNAISRNSEGLGLGLSVVKKIVALHDGEIHLDSIEEKGVCVRVTIPTE